MKNLLSSSILAANFAILGQQVQEADTAGTDYIHVDVMDGVFVPSISFGLPVMTALRSLTDKPLDVHLMTVSPERQIASFAADGADIITFHLEAAKDPAALIDAIHQAGCKAGVSIKPATPVEAAEPFLSMMDMLLIMTVEPGSGGQPYIPASTERIRTARRLCESKGLALDIQVDGGITRENLPGVLAAGANVIVAGSAVFHGNIRENVVTLEEMLQGARKGAM